MGDLFAPSHIILILIFALLFFGPTKLPELGRAFGKTLREFREGTKGMMNDDKPEKPEKIVRQEPLQVPAEVQEVRDVRRLD